MEISLPLKTGHISTQSGLKSKNAHLGRKEDLNFSGPRLRLISLLWINYILLLLGIFHQIKEQF